MQEFVRARWYEVAPVCAAAISIAAQRGVLPYSDARHVPMVLMILIVRVLHSTQAQYANISTGMTMAGRE